MEATTIEKQVEQTWHSKASLVILLLTILGGYYGLTGKFEDDGKKYENHEVRIGQLEADKKEIRDDIKDIKRSNEQILILLQNKEDRK
jgi:hypothetical protein